MNNVPVQGLPKIEVHYNRDSVQSSPSLTRSLDASIIHSPSPLSATASPSKTPSPTRLLVPLLETTALQSGRSSSSENESERVSPLQSRREWKFPHLPPLRLSAAKVVTSASTSLLSSQSAPVTVSRSQQPQMSIEALAKLRFREKFALSHTDSIFEKSPTPSSMSDFSEIESAAKSSNSSTKASFAKASTAQITDLFCVLVLEGSSRHDECRAYFPSVDVNYKKSLKFHYATVHSSYTPLELVVISGWKEAIGALIQRGASLITSTLGCSVWSLLHCTPLGKNEPLFSEKELQNLLNSMPWDSAASFEFVRHLYKSVDGNPAFRRHAEILMEKAVEAPTKPQWWKNPKQLAELLFLAILNNQQGVCEKIMTQGTIDWNYIDSGSKKTIMDLLLQERWFKHALLAANRSLQQQ